MKLKQKITTWRRRRAKRLRSQVSVEQALRAIEIVDQELSALGYERLPGEGLHAYIGRAAGVDEATVKAAIEAGEIGDMGPIEALQFRPAEANQCQH